jgi:4-hydroxy-3-methylbut-2-enyl diphosphate reductase
MTDVSIVLAQPRGFCAGVDRAITIVERALEQFGAPIYVRHEIVHNKYVVDDLRDKGAVFIEELHEAPDGSTVIFSAHGVSLAVRDEAQQRNLHIFDATCPLVTKVHVEVKRMREQGYEIIMIGHKGHPEVEGTMGQVRDGIYLVDTEADIANLQVKTPDHLAYVTQTTLSVDDTQGIIATLKKRFPMITEPKKADICYATQNRQDAVKVLAPQVDVVIVVGSPNSSNSNRLRELAEKMGVAAYMVDNADDVQAAWFTQVHKIGVTAGASAPEVLVESVLNRIKELGASSVSILEGVEESVKFPLPKGLSGLQSIEVKVETL